MMNNFFTTVASAFTGKGSVLKFAIGGSLIAGTVYEVMNANYKFSHTGKDRTVAFSPATETSPVQIQEEPPESRTEITGHQEPDAAGHLPTSQQV